jgi:MoaA/NifB/PqqE/SkfB family radical SAM enzyme
VRILSLTGGEPFLRKDLKDIILSAAKHLPCLERISVPTNGLLTFAILETTKNILAELPPRIFFKIGISLDGPREIHDRMRGVPGAFEKAAETLRQLQNLPHPNFEVGILALFTEENADLLPECSRIFASFTDQITWTLSTESEFFQNVEKGRSSYSGEAEEKILSFLDRVLIPGSPEKAYLYSKYRDHLLKKRRTYPCLAGYRSAYVDTRGNLLPCHYLNEGFAVANALFSTDTLEKAWFSRDARMIRSRLVNNVYCTNCSNNCDFRNLIQEDFWNFFWYLVTHPVIPIKVLFKRRKK